jgi:hypothetical protein
MLLVAIAFPILQAYFFLFPRLPNVDMLVHFLVVENHKNAPFHLPHIVFHLHIHNFPHVIATKAHVHYSFFSSLPKYAYLPSCYYN